MSSKRIDLNEIFEAYEKRILDPTFGAADYMLTPQFRALIQRTAKHTFFFGISRFLTAFERESLTLDQDDDEDCEVADTLVLETREQIQDFFESFGFEKTTPNS